MLSRVADSLCWMSRYFERASNCARVLDATWNVALNPSRTSTEERLRRALTCLGLPDAVDLEPPEAIAKLTMDRNNRSSVVSCIVASRENASQVREEISSEMWEHLNRLYHRVTQASGAAAASGIISDVRASAYKFKGITDSTMNHDEGYYFIRFGKYSERACALSLLMDAYHSAESPATDLDWKGLLTSCAAWEAYCKTYTAELKPELVAEFILLHPNFPYSVRYSVDQMQCALSRIMEHSPSRKSAPLERAAGKLRASLAFVQISDVVASGIHAYLGSIVEQCRTLHAMVHESYIEYPMELALED